MKRPEIGATLLLLTSELRRLQGVLADVTAAVERLQAEYAGPDAVRERAALDLAAAAQLPPYLVDYEEPVHTGVCGYEETV